MPITLRGGQNSIKKALQIQVNQIDESMLKIMEYVGEEFVREARQMTKASGGFGDVTGNLRSSIGYAVVKNGDVITGNIEGTATGTAKFREVIRKLFKMDNSYHLLLIAGMEYASYVEAKGMNVITIQGDQAFASLDTLLKRYKSSKNLTI